MDIFRVGALSLLLSLPSLGFASPDLSSQRFLTPIAGKIVIDQKDVTIRLQHYPLTHTARQVLAERAVSQAVTSPFLAAMKLNQKQLGMNDVPVLNQGAYGSCVTFSNIAALDALLSPKNYISEWCNLTLGQYLENNSKNYQSGWDGSFGEMVLNQIEYFGYISKSEEEALRCGGVENYTVAGAERATMSLSEFNQSSQELQGITWAPILTFIDGAYFKTKDMSDILNQVRATLLSGDRMTLGFLIDISQFFIGAQGQYHLPNDTWVMTPEIQQRMIDGNVDAGHEVVITGFDDDAIVYDEKGGVHQGILTLRNSWGPQAGDHGDYYMSYDYFLVMAVEVQQIFKIS